MKIYFIVILKLLSQVYEEISSHFSETRHKQWPNVTKFLKNLEEGTLLLDVGCGNGKYLYGDRNIYKVLNHFSTSKVHQNIITSEDHCRWDVIVVPD